MKKISIMIPCYNEEENVVPISEAVIKELAKSLSEYDYEILFIDNDSKDNTRPLLREICRKNPKVKAIFNAKTSVSSIRPITECCKHRATAQFVCAAIFKTRSK